MLKIRYLSAKPLFQTRGLSIRGIGIRETMPPCYVRRPHGTGDCLFMIFHDPVEIGNGSEKRLFSAGTVVLWRKSAAHFYGNPSGRWTHSWIHCDGPEVAAALRSAKIRSGAPAVPSNPPRVERCLLHLHEELTGPMPPDPVILRNTLVNLIREAARSGGRPPRPPIPEGLLRARQTIDAHYDEPLDLQRLASVAGLSVPHFCAEFRRCFGAPPIACVIDRRLEVAATLLRGAAMSVGEVGRRCGYEDPYHFSKIFKNRFGLPPKAFRRGFFQGGSSPVPG